MQNEVDDIIHLYLHLWCVRSHSQLLDVISLKRFPDTKNTADDNPSLQDWPKTAWPILKIWQALQ